MNIGIILHGVDTTENIINYIKILKNNNLNNIVIITYKHKINNDLFNFIDRKQVYLINSSSKKNNECNYQDKKNKFFIDVENKINYVVNDKANFHKWKHITSCNLNIFSCKKGIELINKLYPNINYIFRCRIDLHIKNIGMELINFQNIVKYSKSNKYFENKLICLHYKSQDEKNGPLRYNLYISDFLLFGTKNDVNKYYNNINFIDNQNIYNQYRKGKSGYICPENYFIWCNFPDLRKVTLNEFHNNFMVSKYIKSALWIKPMYNNYIDKLSFMLREIFESRFILNIKFHDLFKKFFFSKKNIPERIKTYKKLYEINKFRDKELLEIIKDKRYLIVLQLNKGNDLMSIVKAIGNRKNIFILHRNKNYVDHNIKYINYLETTKEELNEIILDYVFKNRIILDKLYFGY